VEEEVAVDVKVAGFVAINLGTDSLADLALVQVLANIAHTLVAQVTRIFTLATNIVDVLAGSLVRTKEGVVAVDRSRDANPGTLCVVARLDHRLATRQSVIHRLAAGFVKNSRITTLTASHGAVVVILSQTIGETIANEDGLQVDVALLVRQNLRGKYRDVVTSVRLSSNVEVLLGIFGELLEEKGKEGVDVLACSNGVANSGATVRIADIDGLVEEDDRSIGVPGEVIVDRLDLLVDAAGTKLQEQSSKGRTARATVEPQDNRVVLGVITRLEEPVKQMLVILVIIQITSVLLHTRIDTESTRIGLLDSQIIGLQLAIDLSLLLAASSSDPDTLDISTTDDVVPVGVRTTGVLLRQREDRVMIHAVGEVASNLIPQMTSLTRQGLELLLEVMKRLGQCVGTLLGQSEDLLEGRSRRSGRSDQQRSWQNSHDDLDGFQFELECVLMDRRMGG
jgi:hypothetical protein